MISVIDRYILRSLLMNYVIALATMLSLYVVLDMFVNMDEFTERGDPFLIVVRNMFSYYWPNLFLYFKEMAGAITLFACLTTLARMRVQNEMTAVLASGVSLYRIAAPIVFFGLASTTLLVVDTEWLIPSVSHLLARDHDDADGTRARAVMFLRDRNGALLSAGRFDPVPRTLHRLLVLDRDDTGRVVSMIEADVARWEPRTDQDTAGTWRLERGRRVRRVRRAAVGLGPSEDKIVEPIANYPSDLKPEAIQLRQSEGWYRFLSLAELSKLERERVPNLAAIVQTKHARRTQPIISIVMLLLGLPFFLRRTPGQILADAGKCMAACGLCYVTAFVVGGIQSSTPSALPAWIPIFVFGTLAVVLLDRVRT